MKPRWRPALFLLTAALALAGCARPTEEQRLAKFRGSIRYKAYRFASEKTARLAVAEYNKTAARPSNEFVVHATMGVLWYLADKNEYAFIESDMAAASATNENRHFVWGLQSVALSKMKCPGLARGRYDELKAALSAQRNTDATRLEVEHKLVLLILIPVGLGHGDPELARFGADALGAICQLDYLAPLVGAIVEAQEGNPLRAAAQLRELNKSERFAEHKRALFRTVAEIIEEGPEKKKLGRELVDRVLAQLVRRVIEDVFSDENQHALMEKIKDLPDRITGKAPARQSAGGDSTVGASAAERTPVK